MDLPHVRHRWWAQVSLRHGQGAPLCRRARLGGEGSAELEVSPEEFASKSGLSAVPVLGLFGACLPRELCTSRPQGPSQD